MTPKSAASAAWIAGAVTLAVSLSTVDAAAQELQLGAEADVLGGIEGGGSGYAAGVRRARTTVRLGVSGWVDESPLNVISVAALAEIEPRASVGADLRYTRLVGEVFAFHAGVIGIVAPRHMIGATFGVGLRIPIADAFAFSVGPTANLYFLGSDLPDSNVLWQGMLQGGVRVSF